MAAKLCNIFSKQAHTFEQILKIIYIFTLSIFHPYHHLSGAESIIEEFHQLQATSVFVVCRSTRGSRTCETSFTWRAWTWATVHWLTPGAWTGSPGSMARAWRPWTCQGARTSIGENPYSPPADVFYFLLKSGWLSPKTNHQIVQCWHLETLVIDAVSWVASPCFVFNEKVVTVSLFSPCGQRRLTRKL